MNAADRTAFFPSLVLRDGLRDKAKRRLQSLPRTLRRPNHDRHSPTRCHRHRRLPRHRRRNRQTARRRRQARRVRRPQPRQAERGEGRDRSRRRRGLREDLRHQRRSGHRRDDRRRGRGSRPAGRSGEQRRYHPRQPADADDRRRVRRRHPDQPAVGVHRLPGGQPHHGPGQVRPGHQHRLGLGRGGQRRPGQLRRGQGWSRRLHQEPGQRVGEKEHHRQRGRPGFHRHRHDRRPAGPRSRMASRS